MKKIIIASNNPLKIKATINGFRKMFPDDEFKIEAVAVSSGVNDQPTTNEETLLGARNRAKNAFELTLHADYWVGIEGGIEEKNGEMAAFAWVVIKSNELSGKSRTGTFFLPNNVAGMIREGKEMGIVNDIIFNKKNSKQDNGAIGILTQNVIDRTQFYEHAIILALLPFKNVELYKEKG